MISLMKRRKRLKVNLNWITPKADANLAYMARVSNPKAAMDDPSEKLIKYLIDHKHWSPFEMACMCVEIETTRDIARQILRHRSFHFQEFSQRYSEVDEKPELSPHPRSQDPKNRQNSIFVDDEIMEAFWQDIQHEIWDYTHAGYKNAMSVGIAKELARKLLPEGLTRTRMYMQGTLRDWLHYVGIRQGPETQLEHRQIAYGVGYILEHECPALASAAIEANIMRPFAFND